MIVGPRTGEKRSASDDDYDEDLMEEAISPIYSSSGGSDSDSSQVLQCSFFSYNNKFNVADVTFSFF